jgi:2'-5' RNA ligase
MIYEKCTSFEVFGLGLFLPKEAYLYLKKYEKPMKRIVDWFVKDDYKYPGSNSMIPHITLKYLGYHSEHTNEEISKLAPEILQIIKKYLPIKIEVRGIEVGSKYSNLGVLLRFRPSEKLKKLHEEIIQKLGDKIDLFKKMDGDNFEPHIAIATAEKTKENQKALERIARKSCKDKEIELILTEPYIFMKDKGPVRLKELMK